MMRLHPLLTKLFSVIALFASLLVAYVYALRPSLLRWGATPGEMVRPMPGDELLRNPTFDATRAITIHGRPQDIWPWIVQMGYDRAGFYGYDLIENAGSTRGIRSAQKIVPELQHPAMGDRVYMSRIAYLIFDSIVPNRYLLWTGDATPPGSAFTWAVYPVDADHSRLISRIRIRYHWTDRLIVLDLFTEFADPVAVPKILEGVKDRVEGRKPEALGIQAVEISLWIVALVEFVVAVVCVFRWEQWWRACILALASAGVLLFALYARQPVWMGATFALALGAALSIGSTRMGKFHRPRM
jgi:hypothetical protein